MARPDPKEMIGTIGLALVVAGVSRWSINAGLILAGMMLFGFALLTAKATSQKKDVNESDT